MKIQFILSITSTNSNVIKIFLCEYIHILSVFNDIYKVFENDKKKTAIKHASAVIHLYRI